MSLPLLRLQPISTAHYQTSGDVVIAEGVAIAPGVLLQAEPESHVIVKTGACIGVGAILHAYQGTVEIGEGANIGAEVLLIGHVKVGDHACVGAATTILNSSIELGQVVPPGSLIGDLSRSAEELQVIDAVIVSDDNARDSANGSAPAAAPEAPQRAESTGVNVYGQMYVNNMFVKLFPTSKPAAAGSVTSDKPALPEDPWDD
jgi:carbon dioxide concentrating mechanism protein CcmN